MKRFFSTILISNIILQTYLPLIALWESSKQEKTFVVTAYYSPLPNQSFYLRGNYEDEVALNGEGTHWASGKKVFPWMLAAPKNYPFWTKIELDWIGLGSVEDRGGAIVNAGKRGYENDRIDMWMWYGEEWLRKALNWGKRKVKWVVYWQINTTPSINLAWIPWIQKSSNNSLKQNSPLNIFDTGIWKDSPKETIQALQKFLKEIDLYTGEINGEFNTTIINNIYTFQKEHWIVSSPDDIGAGYWWIKTRKQILDLYQKWEFKGINPKQEKPFELFSSPISSSSTEGQVKELQEFFTDIKYYDGEINGKYSDIYATIIDYQLDKKIIQDENDQVAWYWGPKTREEAKKDFDTFKAKKKKEEEFIKKMEDLKLSSLASANDTLEKIWEVKKWDTSLWVRELQKTLKKLWVFDSTDTAIFWDKTEEALYNYQVSKELVQNPTDIWAWKLGPKTKEALKNDLANLILQDQVEQTQITMK